MYKIFKKTAALICSVVIVSAMLSACSLTDKKDDSKPNKNSVSSKADDSSTAPEENKNSSSEDSDRIVTEETKPAADSSSEETSDNSSEAAENLLDNTSETDEPSSGDSTGPLSTPDITDEFIIKTIEKQYEAVKSGDKDALAKCMNVDLLLEINIQEYSEFVKEDENPDAGAELEEFRKEVFEAKDEFLDMAVEELGYIFDEISGIDSLSGKIQNLTLEEDMTVASTTIYNYTAEICLSEDCLNADYYINIYVGELNGEYVILVDSIDSAN